MRSVRPLLLASVVAASTVGVAPPREAAACGNEVELRLTPVQHIATAERDLDDGRVGEAASRVRASYPNIRLLGAEAPPLAQRAERIYALALVRANGQLDAGLGWARAGNFEWAIETLRELDEKRPNDPRSQADLAEARTRVMRTRAEAVRTLEGLDQRDLLGSAFAYLALSRARSAAGDDGGAQAALRRCSMMSTDKRRCALDLMGEPIAPGPPRRG
ncbi:MAG TPA: hypothetical protein VLT33_38995 [Labilithrix sp.]|nr:hypothetical protein [Labilithrix sp.]